MEKLTIDQLHELRLHIFDNAESLHKEAKLLLDNGFYARAFLLAYFTCEELGKIPIVVGVIGRMLKNETVDWKKVKKVSVITKPKLILTIFINIFLVLKSTYYATLTSSGWTQRGLHQKIA